MTLSAASIVVVLRNKWSILLWRSRRKFASYNKVLSSISNSPGCFGLKYVVPIILLYLEDDKASHRLLLVLPSGSETTKDAFALFIFQFLCPMLKIDRRKTLFLKHSFRRLSLLV